MEEAQFNSLRKFLDKMDVPGKRKIFNLHNLLWLNRNLFIKNENHPDFPQAMKLIGKMLKSPNTSSNSEKFPPEDAAYR